MLHLAQVATIESSGKLGLRLIARQRSEYAWTVLPEQDVVLLDAPLEYGEGALVLVTLSDTRQVVQIQSPNPWLIDIIQTFLRSGITPAFLQAEADRAEQWRQNLTLQSQDLDRRALELEARREQIEQLEESLKREKKQLESMAVQYKDQTQTLDRQTTELTSLQQRVEQLEAILRQEQQRVEQLEASLRQERQQMADFLEQRGMNSQSSN